MPRVAGVEDLAAVAPVRRDRRVRSRSLLAALDMKKMAAV